MPTLEGSFSPRHNSLNFLRLMLATAVVFSHSIALGSFGSETILGKTTVGMIAVYGFFGISGFLIARSASSRGVGRYLWQRFLRIFPGYWACLAVTAFLFGAVAWFHQNPTLSRTCGVHCYLTEPNGPFGYIAHNLWLKVNQFWIARTLPGTHSLGTWNGSLWTLWYEFVCYLLLAGAAVLGLLKRRWWIASAAALVWLAEIVIASVPSFASALNPWSDFNIMRLLAFVPIFLAGSLLHLFRERIPDSGALALGSTILFLVGLLIPVGGSVPAVTMNSPDLTAVFLVYPLVWLGIHLPFHAVGAANDYSYGIYIYAFPIQQLLLLWGLNRWGYLPYTLLTLAGIAPFALASWWLVEKHALKLKSIKGAGRVPRARPREEIQSESPGLATRDVIATDLIMTVGQHESTPTSRDLEEDGGMRR
jgi:peptidoglycan/LPS O-acetylase OafA/YrhL